MIVVRPALPADAHKGAAGRVLVLAGSELMPGAAILATRAALRGGAGLVTLACADESLLVQVPAAVPEVVLLDLSRGPFPSGDSHARLAGPGLGADARTRSYVELLLAEVTEAPLVLDADALNVFAGEPERLADAAAPLVLTPHPGEAARLLGRVVGAGAEQRLDAARELARRARAVCCLKGPGTVVADADGTRVLVNPTGSPALATAGAGDVLAGHLVACLADGPARGLEDWTPFDAAVWSVRVHGRAGELAAEEWGLRGTTASDVIRALPRAERDVERDVEREAPGPS